MMFTYNFQRRFTPLVLQGKPWKRRTPRTGVRL
jgi:hypothetical protein